MSMDYISREVMRIKNKYRENDPYRLCDAMGLILLFEPMGLYEGACKGFFLMQSRKKSITINCDLPEHLQRIILAHEVGHAVLHRNMTGIKAFHDFALFNETSQYEYEANIFAAEYLMDDDDVLGLLNEDMSFFEAASMLCVPAELLDFKFRILKRKGYKVIDPPLIANGDFLKRINAAGGSVD